MNHDKSRIINTARLTNFNGSVRKVRWLETDRSAKQPEDPAQPELRATKYLENRFTAGGLVFCASSNWRVKLWSLKSSKLILAFQLEAIRTIGFKILRLN